jgi:hypothetical protein
VGIRALSTRVKQPSYEIDHSLPINAEVKNMWIYVSNPPYMFMA